MAHQHLLDVTRVPVDAVDVEALRQPATHEHVALVVHDADVARVQPAVAQRLGGRVGRSQ